MKKMSIFLTVFVLTSWSASIFAAVQVVNGAPPVALNANGVADGASFTGQAVTPSTLTVGIGQNINNNGNAIGVSTDSPGVGTIIFQGTSGISIVNGSVGAINSMSNIQAGLGASSVTFNGVVSTATFNVTGNGTVQFNNTANAALTFNTDGTLIVGGGATFNGAVNNLAANTGTLILNNASTLNGAVGSAVGALKQVTVVGGNATINGALGATNFTLGTNTLFLVGALALPTNTVINTTVISDTLFGNINAAGHNDNISAAVVTINVDATNALLTGAPLFVVNAGSGSSNVPIIVNSTGLRYSFIGNNSLGSITIIPTLIPASQLVTNPTASAVGTVLDALIPIAASDPGSDLALVERLILALPTAAALEDALLQIAPASGLVGVARESFNTTKQFQKVWLKHLRNRDYCRFQNFDDCCDPCENECEGPTLWADAFGYYGHQDFKDQLNGYNVNTWGGVVALEVPFLCGLRAGFGGGYAFTDLDEKSFGNNTNINNYQGTFYLSYDIDPWFVDGGISLGWNRYDGTRHISFTGLDRTATAKYDGEEYSGFVSTGYNYYCNNFEITPFASLLYSHLHLHRYSENGADSLNMDVDKQDYDFLESGLGLKLAYLYQTCRGIFIPELHSIWFHDFNRNSFNVNSSFTGLGAAGGTFSNTGPRIDRDTWNIGAGVTCVLNTHLSLQFIYEYELSNTYFDHQGTLGLSYDF